MRPSKWLLVLLAMLAGALTTGNAFAWGRTHVFIGFNFGFPAYWPGPYYAGPAYYPAPIYYPAPVYAPAPVVIQSAPPVYVQRAEPIAAPASRSYWYYCPDSSAYYPYVRTCPGGWQHVSPTPR